MIHDLFVPVCAAAQICFVRLFLSSFLEDKCRKNEASRIAVLSWLLVTAFVLLGADGIYGHLVLLLAASLMLLAIHGEYSAKGLGLLTFVFLICAALDAAVRHLIEPLDGLPYELAAAGGKLLPIFLALALHRVRRPRGQNDQIDPDGPLLRQYMQMQQESMAALEQSYRMQRKSTHEFEHHLQVLRDLLEQGQAEAARAYLERLKKNRSIHLICVNSRHPVVDVILNQKYQMAQENGIKMQIQVNDLSALNIPSDALTVVLTNLLDNAIEACRRIDGYREIICSILYEDGLYLSIRNTSDPVQITDGKIPTSKPDSLSHGFGLMSVGYVLDALEAEYTFGYEEGWFHFAAEIEEI